MNPIGVQPGLLAGVGLPPLGPRVVQMLSMESMVVPGTRDGRVVPRVEFSITKRNPPPLFGAGLIDAIPDEVLYEVALAQPPAVRGRVHRMKTGQAGRFGWKAQVASLKDFVMSACASELGLEAPGHHQADSPLDPDAMADARVGARENMTKQVNIALAEITQGIRPIAPSTPFKPNGRALDLTQDECDALTAYVADLPAPVPVRPSSPRQASSVEQGRRTFQSIGCAVCHTPDLGQVRDIYSDLLLHDMGGSLSDVGGYYNDSEDPDSPDSPSVSEWRTPPLWGIRDSGPYLHDGRAAKLQEAINQHEGQAAQSARGFRALGSSGQSSLLAFLNSLAAPGSTGVVPERSGAEPPPHANRRQEIGDAIDRATALVHAAQVLERFGKISDALDRYRKAVQEAPESRAGRAAAERIRILERN